MARVTFSAVFPSHSGTGVHAYADSIRIATVFKAETTGRYSIVVPDVRDPFHSMTQDGVRNCLAAEALPRHDARLAAQAAAAAAIEDVPVMDVPVEAPVVTKPRRVRKAKAVAA